MLTWHVLRDGHKICPICLDLDNYTWVFDTREGASGLMSNGLMHPTYGLVWTMTGGSSVHELRPELYGKCHCSFSIDFDLSDLLASAQDLLRAVEQLVPEGEIIGTSRGEDALVWRVGGT
jgi:hypothetical protein